MDVVNCGQCGADNRVGARFCGDCGSVLIARCAACDHELRPDQKFCDECGTPNPTFVAQQPSRSEANDVTKAVGLGRSDPVRKIVTVMFADLGGSTGFGERVDAETSRSVIAQYHAMLQAVIDEHRGTVAKSWATD